MKHLENTTKLYMWIQNKWYHSSKELIIMSFKLLNCLYKLDTKYFICSYLRDMMTFKELIKKIFLNFLLVDLSP